MSKQTIPLDYANNLMYELEKAFWDERGKGARFRVTKVGNQYFEEKIKPLLTSTEVTDILEKIQGDGVSPPELLFFPIPYHHG